MKILKEDKRIHNINEEYYRTWRRLRFVRENVFYIPIIFLFPMLVIYSSPQRLPLWATSIVLILGILFILIYIFFMFPSLILKRSYLKKICRGASLYLVEIASVEIEKDDSVRVSFVLSQLFYSLYDYLDQIIFKLGKLQYSQTRMFGFDLISIRKRYLLTYLQTTYHKSELKNTLADLSSDLNNTWQIDYKPPQSFVMSIFNGVEKHSATKKGREVDIALQILGFLVQIVLVAISIK